MAINQNHLFEELDGVKCAIVEKNASKERAGFLRRILEFNRYTVVVVPSPAPKAAPAAAPPPASPAAATPPAATPAPTVAPAAPPDATAPAPAAATPPTATPAPTVATPAAAAPTPTAATPAPDAATPAAPTPETFTIGVTDTTFNPTNAIFGRLLKAPGGHVVTLAYWQQKDSEAHDEVPYFEQ